MAQQSLAEAHATLASSLFVGLGLGEVMSDQPAGVGGAAKPSAARKKPTEQRAKAAMMRGLKRPDCELGFFFMGFSFGSPAHESFRSWVRQRIVIWPQALPSEELAICYLISEQKAFVRLARKAIMMRARKDRAHFFGPTAVLCPISIYRRYIGTVNYTTSSWIKVTLFPLSTSRFQHRWH